MDSHTAASTFKGADMGNARMRGQAGAAKMLNGRVGLGGSGTRLMGLGALMTSCGQQTSTR